MAGDPELQHLNRTLKEISHSLRAQTKALEALNTNLVLYFRSMDTPKVKDNDDQ